MGKVRKRVNEELGPIRFSLLKFRCELCKGRGYVDVPEPTKERKLPQKQGTPFSLPLAIAGAAAAFAVMWYQAEPNGDLSIPFLAGIIGFAVMGRLYKAVLVLAVILFVLIVLLA